MEKFIEWIDESIKSQQALVEEYESDPTSQQYKDAVEGINKLLNMRLLVTNADLDKEEKLRTLELKEKELNSKIDELNDRMIIEERKMLINFGGSAALVVLIIVYESYGHLFKDGALRVVNTVKRVVMG